MAIFVFFCLLSGYQFLDSSILKIFVSELVATALLLFLGCSGGLDWDHGTHGFLASLSFGLTVTILVQSFGHISGAHLNPCVTIAAVLMKITAAPVGYNVEINRNQQIKQKKNHLSFRWH